MSTDALVRLINEAARLGNAILICVRRSLDYRIVFDLLAVRPAPPPELSVTMG